SLVGQQRLRVIPDSRTVFLVSFVCSFLIRSQRQHPSGARGRTRAKLRAGLRIVAADVRRRTVFEEMTVLSTSPALSRDAATIGRIVFEQTPALSASSRRRLQVASVFARALSAIGVAWLLCFSLGSPRVFAADVEDAQKQFIAGDYTNCIRVCEQAVGARDGSEEWKLLLAQSLLTVGRYTNALAVISSALAQHASSVRVRLLAYDVLRQNGRTDDAKRMLDEINNLAGS